MVTTTPDQLPRETQIPPAVPRPPGPGKYLLLAATTAAGAALLSRGSRWHLPLAATAVLSLGRAIGSLRATAAAIPRNAAPELLRSALVDGILMRWEEHGIRTRTSTAVVFLHGLPTNPRAWRYVIPQVERDGIYCLAWEQVGFGGSLAAGLGRDISIPRQAEYLHAWLRSLEITRAVFVAHDYGGGVLPHFLLAHPEMALGVVLSDSVAYDNWPVVAVRTARSMSDMIEHLPPTLVKPFFLAALRNLGHQYADRAAEAAELFWHPYAQPIGPRAFAHQLRHFDARDTLSVAHDLARLQLDAPVRVIWGSDDPLGLPSAEQVAKDLNAPLEIIPDGRHFTIEDHPDVIADAVNDVLAQIRGE